MNIYLISAIGDVVGYDSYDAHVVQAWTEHDARRCVPHGGEVGWTKPPKRPTFWTDPETAICEIIGVSLESIQGTQTILSSYNAG